MHYAPTSGKQTNKQISKQTNKQAYLYTCFHFPWLFKTVSIKNMLIYIGCCHDLMCFHLFADVTLSE